MKDIIQLLPDHLANQIAAGEVVQRPSSVVKELMENALDAGATEIQLIVKDAGKELIQVVDNGCGMNPIDARMSFERHATSKIKSIEDLFAIKTMGFRGEALASIAAVAQVELKTRPADVELGVCLQVEASEVKKQDPVACPAGTNFAIRNLFYNVPARRKFLKSNSSEYKHILDEFTHISMAFPDIAFRLFHNQTEQFYLKPGSLKSRIVDLLGTRSEQNLIPVTEQMEWLQIDGFVGKPSSATKTRGNQFFFVNNRFIRSPYLNHAVVAAFEGLIDKESYPMYVLRFTIDAESVDVNVHPSKQEVKFDDEQMLYACLHAAVKHSLAKYNVMPSLDFSLNPEIQNTDAVRLPFSEHQRRAARQGFLAHSFSEGGKAHLMPTRNERQDWEQQRNAFFPSIPDVNNIVVPEEALPAAANLIFSHQDSETTDAASPILQWGAYLATTVKSGMLLMHQTRARERIIFENLERQIKESQPVAQRLLFPFEIDGTPAHKALLLEEALPFLNRIGFEIEAMLSGNIIVNGLPVGLTESSGERVLGEILEHIQSSPLSLKDPMKRNLLEQMSRSMAQNSAGGQLNDHSLIDELFACREPQFSPSGKKVFVILSPEKLNTLL